MNLKAKVSVLLKERNRTMSWLAKEMDRTFDGLKGSLVNGSIKYVDLVKLLDILSVSPQVLFEDPTYSQDSKKTRTLLADNAGEYLAIKRDLANCTEIVAGLKSQIKDKEKIISLMHKS